MSAAHPGFKAVQDKIAAREGLSHQRAGAILASASRKASPKAKAANPRLKKVGPKPSDYAGPPSPGGGPQGPRLNINYKDLSPEEQDQAAKKAGLQPGPGPVPPGVTTAPEKALVMAQPGAPAMSEKGEDPAEESKETPDQEQAENQAKSDLSPPAGHHAVAAHVRKNPIVSKAYAEKLKRRGAPVT